MPDISDAYGSAALAGALVPDTTYWMSLHNGDPSTTGANEIYGSGYSRQSVQFGEPSNNVQSSTTSQTFTDLPAVSGNLFVGHWTEQTDGAYLIGSPTYAVLGPIPSGATVTFSEGADQIQAG